MVMTIIANIVAIWIINKWLDDIEASLQEAEDKKNRELAENNENKEDVGWDKSSDKDSSESSDKDWAESSDKGSDESSDKDSGESENYDSPHY